MDSDRLPVVYIAGPYRNQDTVKVTANVKFSVVRSNCINTVIHKNTYS